jgi:DNA-binding MarR family transcriptional regulator
MIDASMSEVIVRGHATARRRMTPGELATWRALLDTTAELRRVLGSQLLQETGLSPADYQVLLPLSEAGKRLRSSELAATIDWERSRLSHQLARRERRGLIRRDECATESRGAEVSLTSAGAEAFRRATAPHLRAIKTHFADALTAEQLQALANILQSPQHHLHPERVADRAGEGAS